MRTRADVGITHAAPFNGELAVYKFVRQEEPLVRGEPGVNGAPNAALI